LNAHDEPSSGLLSGYTARMGIRIVG